MSANYNPYLARINRPQRKIVGPSQQFVSDELGAVDEVGPPSAAGQYVGASGGSGTGFLSEQLSPVDVTTGGDPGESEAQEKARDDGTASPSAARQYISAYMADPEWKQAHASEDDLVEKIAPGIGNMILDRLTRGAYSRQRFAQLDAARLRKREVEKRYLDIANLERQTIADNQAEMDGLNKNTAANMDYAKQDLELKNKQVESRYLPATAEAAVAQAQANVDRTVAGTEAVRAGTVAGKYMNVPANTNLVNARPDGTAVTVASGPNKEWNPNTGGGSSRDYSQVTGSSTQEMLRDMIKLRDDPSWDTMNPGKPNPYAGKTNDDLAMEANRLSGLISGGGRTPRAAPQFTGVNRNDQGLGMWGIGGQPAAPGTSVPRQRLKLGPNGEIIR